MTEDEKCNLYIDTMMAVTGVSIVGSCALPILKSMEVNVVDFLYAIPGEFGVFLFGIAVGMIAMLEYIRLIASNGGKIQKLEKTSVSASAPKYFIGVRFGDRAETHNLLEAISVARSKKKLKKAKRKYEKVLKKSKLLEDKFPVAEFEKGERLFSFKEDI